MLKEVIKYAVDNGINPESKIINITHVDLDGIVSTINLMNYFDEVFYVQKNYDGINQYFTDIIFKDNHVIKDPDFIIVTDISVTEEVIKGCEERGLKLIILDHHETAYELNKFGNVYVDEGEELSGAGVTLEFIKGLGYESDKLDKINDIANQFDLFIFKNRPELGLRKFDVMGKKLSLAEMLNTVFFNSGWEKDNFIERWFDGWGKGFNAEEIEIIKKDRQSTLDQIEKVVGSKKEVKLSKNKVLVLEYQCMIGVAEYYMDEENFDLVVFFDTERNKFSGRVKEGSKINIGKIFKLLHEKFEWVDNGGGHEKAGGGNIKSIKHLDELIENIVKLAEYYEK
jgi:oligoribonuclease NrnB/cAMP/cGMP phosphodiesterase (DHH superfamily)